MMISIVGHPFASIGMGEQMRSCLRALQALRVEYEVVDIYRYADRDDEAHRKLALQFESPIPTRPIRIFHINGDEVDACLKALSDRGFDFDAGFNIIMPAWELGQYPEVWGAELKRFDQVWAISHFVQSALAASGIESVHIGQACEFPAYCFLPRRFFGVRESSYTFLHFFDQSSYRARKNPEAVIELFRRLIAKRPLDDLQLVLKVKGGDNARTIAESIVGRPDDRIKIIDSTLSTFETLSLINASDCFVSLHRAEGYGRGGAEAMLLGRLVMGTAWSGNLDYMTIENSLPVNYDLVPVGAGEYPFGEGQYWAEADVDHALFQALRVVDRKGEGERIARMCRASALLSSGNRAVGIRMVDALKAVENMIN